MERFKFWATIFFWGIKSPSIIFNLFSFVIYSSNCLHVFCFYIISFGLLIFSVWLALILLHCVRWRDRRGLSEVPSVPITISPAVCPFSRRVCCRNLCLLTLMCLCTVYVTQLHTYVTLSFQKSQFCSFFFSLMNFRVI